MIITRAWKSRREPKGRTSEAKSRGSSSLRRSRTIISILMLLGYGCASMPPEVSDTSLVQEARTFYAATSELGLSTHQVAAYQFRDLPGNTLGLCQVYSRGKRVVLIDVELAGDEVADLRRDVLYHELIHCALDQFEHVAGDGIFAAETNELIIEEQGGPEQRLLDYLEWQL